MDLWWPFAYDMAMQILIALLSYLGFFLLTPLLFTHPKLRNGFLARMGLYSSDHFGKKKQQRILLHGASAGDVLALIPLVRELRKLSSDREYILSTITNSGHAMAKLNSEHFDHITYMAYDLPGATGRMLDHIQPDILILEYTELWPNLIHQAKKRGVGMAMHNGRISQSQYRNYRVLFRIGGNILQKLDLLLMRSEADAERALALNAPKERTLISGNTKYDNLVQRIEQEKQQALRKACGLREDSLVWVAGSTHEGEEELLFQTYLQLKIAFPQLAFVIGPRYADRAPRLGEIANTMDINFQLRSENKAENSNITIIDTIGELSLAYSLANVVFVGGSFTLRHGQNILEPAACAKPVVFGPNMDNFSDAVALLLGRGGIQVANQEQLYKTLLELLGKKDEMVQLGLMAKKNIQHLAGVAEKNAKQIEELLAQRQATT